MAVETDRLKAEAGIIPGLAVVLVGDDPASRVYVAGKGRTAEEIGFHSVQYTLPAEASEAEVLALVERLNHDPTIHGILVQLPLPWAIDKNRGHRGDPAGEGRRRASPDQRRPACHRRPGRGCAVHAGGLPAADQAHRRQAAGRDDRGGGRPLQSRRQAAWRSFCLRENCTVTVAHSKTRDLAETVRGGDIVVAAVGRPQMVRGVWLKPGCIVIDVGINRVPAPERGEGKTRLVGDVAFAEASAVAARHHAGAGRRRPDDHRDADGEHAGRRLPQRRLRGAHVRLTGGSAGGRHPGEGRRPYA